ncbi:WecB/TagA/CpsF family glycosyltransferase, partial [Candidatus Pelagibacter sp.]|nr:WecB/TagA/CpsF family glycosyltransferase [Candidatus Pelagibacter sp.]
QEILGKYLKDNLKNKVTILCTGGAISFFTKDQAPINSFIDELYLGWLVRLIFNPIVFFSRFMYAFKLIPMVIFNETKVIK